MISAQTGFSVYRSGERSLSMITQVSAASALLALTIALAACGDDDNASEPKAPTKAQFVRRVCAIELAANRRLQAAGRVFKRGTSEKQFVNAKVAPIFQNSVIEPLDALTPPEGDGAAGRRDGRRRAAGARGPEGEPELDQGPAGQRRGPVPPFGQSRWRNGLRCPSA